MSNNVVEEPTGWWVKYSDARAPDRFTFWIGWLVNREEGGDVVIASARGDKGGAINLTHLSRAHILEEGPVLHGTCISREEYEAIQARKKEQ